MEVGAVASQQVPVGATIKALRIPLLDIPFWLIPLHPGDVVPALAATVLPTMAAVIAPPALPHVPDELDAHFVLFLQQLGE